MANTFPSTVTIDQGRTFTFTTVWTDNTGTPINLTGYTVNFALATDYKQTPLVALSIGSGITVTPLTGTILVEATPAQTEVLTNTGYVGELMVTSGGGQETTLLKGYIQCASKVVV